MSSTSIISGGSRGLGLALVRRLLDRGDRVGTFSRASSAGLDELAAFPHIVRDGFLNIDMFAIGNACHGNQGVTMIRRRNGDCVNVFVGAAVAEIFVLLHLNTLLG